MKKQLIITAVLFLAIISKAQIKVVTGGYVSVGSTSAPLSSYKMQVFGDALFSTSTSTTSTSAPMIRSVSGYSTKSLPDYTWRGDNTTGFFHPSATAIGVTLADAEKFRFNTNGFTSYGYGWFFAKDSTVQSAAYVRGRNLYSSALVPDYTWYNNDQTGFFHPALNVIGFSISGAEKMRIHSNGFLGVASTSPAYAIDIGTGDMNVNTLSNGYRLNGKLVLFQNNVASCIFVGDGAGASTTGVNNIATGYRSLYTNSSGTNGTAVGYQAMNKNTTASYNSAFGSNALYNNTTGTPNDAYGAFSLYSNTTGYLNTAMGDSAMYLNVTGIGNVAIGAYAMKKNTGNNNAAVGAKALYSNTSGGANAALGFAALNSNTIGSNLTGIGYQALLFNTEGVYNTGVGYRALFNNGTTSGNTALGCTAGDSYSGSSYCTFIGFGADGDNSYSNATAIGNGAIVTGTDKVRIGNTSVTQIGGQVGWSTLSDSRFKTDVQENVKGLEFINKLRPVTYKIDAEAYDNFVTQNLADSALQMHKAGANYAAASAIVRSGLLAQEVEQAANSVGFVSSIVSAPVNTTDVYSLSYGEFVVPLIKGMQELSKKTDSLTDLTHDLDSINKALQDQIDYLSNNCCSSSPTGQRTNTTENKTESKSSWLAQNKPNPFSTETAIDYNVVEEGTANVIIFDLNGKLLKTLPIKIPGKGSVTISSRELTPGMYHYALVVNGKEIATKKMILTE
jgi:trimeric autotransporter adhesin